MRLLHPLSLLAFPLALLAGGCASAPDQETSAASCSGEPDASVYSTAVDEFIKGMQPTPLRFLTAVGTDSALPTLAFQAVQDRGPSYLYPTDSAGRQVVLDRLEAVGPWSSLLVSWHGVEKHDSVAEFRFGGTFVGGKDDGTVAPSRTIAFVCDTTPWRLLEVETDSAM